jgi:tetratricopeptide (TPR) repeat protein
MKRKLSLLLLLLVPLTGVFARAFIAIEWYPVDSLLKVLPAQQGIERVQTLNRLSISLSFVDAEKSTHFADQAMMMAKRINYNEGIAAAYSNYGFIQFYEGNYPDALNFFYEALNIYEELGNLRKVAAMNMEIATTHFYANNIEKAIEIAENQVIPGYRAKDDKGIPVGGFNDTTRTFSKLGLPYRMTGRSDKALIIYQRYVEAGRKHGFDITDLLVHEAIVASCFLETGNVDSAVCYFRKALAYPEVNQSVHALKHEYKRRLASIYTVYGEPDSALYYYRRAYQWLEHHGYLRSAFLAAYELGLFYNQSGRKTEAENSWLNAESLLDEMTGQNSYYRYDSLKYTVSYGTELYFPYTKKHVKEDTYRFATRVYSDLYRYYQEKDHLRPAMHYLQAYTAAKDTLDRLTRNREAVEIQTKYESVRKDAEIRTLSKANEIKELKLLQFRWFIAGISGLAVVIALFAWLLHKQFRLKNSRQMLILQQQLFRSQINPHFIFNALTNIQSAIINEKPEVASKYLTRFSKLVRSILNSTIAVNIALEEEINTVDNYLALQKVRFPEKFDYSVYADPRLDTERIKIPPMLLQPFIENAMEHGIRHKQTPGLISVRFLYETALLKIEIEDNGVGREQAMKIMQERGKDHKSMAIGLIQERIELLNKQLKQKTSFEIIDLKNEDGEAKGTRVVFKVPF